jgi:hypothetical protein
MDDLVDMGTSAELCRTGSLTITAWINPRSWGGGGFGRIVDCRGFMTGATGYYLYIDSNLGDILEFGKDASGPSEDAKSSPAAIRLGAWQHVAATYDANVSMGSNVTLYVGATPVGTGFWLMGPTGAQKPFYLGAQPDSLLRTFDGVIDDVRIYDRALSQLEIQAIAAQ